LDSVRPSLVIRFRRLGRRGHKRPKKGLSEKRTKFMSQEETAGRYGDKQPAFLP
jgi:hypothetical protein